MTEQDTIRQNKTPSEMSALDDAQADIAALEEELTRLAAVKDMLLESNYRLTEALGNLIWTDPGELSALARWAERTARVSRSKGDRLRAVAYHLAQCAGAVERARALLGTAHTEDAPGETGGDGQ